VLAVTQVVAALRPAAIICTHQNAAAIGADQVLDRRFPLLAQSGLLVSQGPLSVVKRTSVPILGMPKAAIRNHHEDCVSGGRAQRFFDPDQSPEHA